MRWSLLLIATDLDKICFVKTLYEIVHCVIQNNRNHKKPLRSFINTETILLLKYKYYVFYPSIGIELKISKYPVSSNLNTSRYRLITISDPCCDFDSGL